MHCRILADIARRRSRVTRFETSVFVMSRSSLRRSPSRRRSPPDCAYCFGELSGGVKVIYRPSPERCRSTPPTVGVGDRISDTRPLLMLAMQILTCCDSDD